MSTSSSNPITVSVVKKMKKKPTDDPTEGDGRRWAKGAKFHFLSGLLVRWGDARELAEMSSFYSRVTLLFLRQFTWDHSLDVDGTGTPGDPSEEDLDEVLDVRGLTAEEIARRNVIYLDLRGKLQRWFRYHGTKSLKSRKPENSLAKIIKAFGTQTKPPRRMQTLQFYSKLYYESRVKTIVDAEWPKVVAEAGAKGAKPPKRLKHQNAVLTRIFASEPLVFQEALKAQRDAEHEEEVALWKAARLDFGDAARSPQEYHEALEEASHWLPGFADALSKYLGLNASVVLSGPIGSKGGRIDVKAVHSGKSKGVLPTIWPDHDPHSYKVLVKGLIAFGNACFSEEECRRRALPGTVPEEGGELMGSSTRAPSPSTAPSTASSRPPSPAPVASVSRPLAPVLAALLEPSQQVKKAPVIQPRATAGVPMVMPPPLRMTSLARPSATIAAVPAARTTSAGAGPTGAIHGPIPRSGAPATATAEVAGANACASSGPGISSTTTTPSAVPAPSTSSAATVSPSTDAPLSPSSTTSSASSLIVLPPTAATSQGHPAPSLPGKTTATSGKSLPRLKVNSKQPLASQAAVPSSPPLTPSSAPESCATSPPPSPPSSPNPVTSGLPISHNPALDSAASSQQDAFSRLDAANCTPDINRVVEYLMKHDTWGPVWEHCVATYVEIERYAQFEACGSLQNPTGGRPSEVSAWMKRARKLVDFQIKSVGDFADAWFGWWRNNQSDDWSALNVTGPNGIRLFLLTLAWWGSALEDNDEVQGARWADALSEVRVAFDHVLVAAAEEESEAGEAAEAEVPPPESKKRRRGTITTPSVVKKHKRGSKN
ncbi:hypothetical protein OH76DRAFT_1488412 [Lentinus brumalis]|uniref:Uncharacterized protein n=1 Tax=Lentinus brumalis TaxID=2498619 RepID=A0A371CQY5_9APHY|nr:hypothetical protein OH76DRAFT_1488412 [Polyporus brumalis]